MKVGNSSIWFMVTELEDEIGEPQIRNRIVLRTSKNKVVLRRSIPSWKRRQRSAGRL